MRIAICLTTFLRNTLAYNTIQTIQSQLSEDCILLIADQNKNDNRINQNPNWHYTSIYNLDFDIGLSASRNYLVNKASELKCEYVIITADSIQFTDKYNFQPMIEMLESNPNLAKIGFNIKNRQNFTYDLEIHPKYNKFVVIKPRRQPISHHNIEYMPCDICCNLFIGKTAILKDSWSNELKLGEHESHCIELKWKGYKTLYTDAISAEYINDKPDEYKQKRNRLYSEFKTILKKKYNLDPDGSWLIYNHKLPIQDQIK